MLDRLLPLTQAAQRLPFLVAKIGDLPLVILFLLFLNRQRVVELPQRLVERPGCQGLVARQRQEPRRPRRVGRGAAIAGGHEDGLHAFALRQFPGDGVFAAAAAESIARQPSAAAQITGAVNLPLFLLEGVAILAEVFAFIVVLMGINAAAGG